MKTKPGDEQSQIPSAIDDGVLSVTDSLDGLVKNPTLELPSKNGPTAVSPYLDEHVVDTAATTAKHIKLQNGDYVLDSPDGMGRTLAHDQQGKTVMIVTAPDLEAIEASIYPHPMLPEILDRGKDETGNTLVAHAQPSGMSLFDALQDGTNQNNRNIALQVLNDLARLNRYLVARGYALVGIDPRDVLLSPTHLSRLPVLRKVGDTPPAEAPRYGSPERAAGLPVTGEEGSFVLGGLLYHVLSGHALSEGEVPQTFPNLPGAPQVLNLLMAAAGNRASPGESLDLLLALQQHVAPQRTWLVGAASSVGTNPERTLNEDAYSFQVQQLSGNGPSLVACVADGMGGMAAGEVAARAAVQAFVLQPAQDILPSAIRARVLAANQALTSALDGKNGGCTFTGVLAESNHVVIGHVGDTRAYHVQAGSATQITNDHSIVAMLVKMGVIDEAASHSHPDANKVTRALGGSKELSAEQIDTFELTLSAGDAIVVMSDGVWNALDPLALNTILTSTLAAQEMADKLIKSALDAGSTDNVTALVARYNERITS